MVQIYLKGFREEDVSKWTAFIWLLVKSEMNFKVQKCWAKF